MSDPRPNRTNEELTRIARDYCSGIIFTDRDAHQDDFTHVFMPFIFMDKEARDDLIKEDPQLFFEYLDKAGPRSVNGIPVFFSFQYLNKEEFEIFKQKVEKIQSFMETL